jgi:hypothetical protein
MSELSIVDFMKHRHEAMFEDHSAGLEAVEQLLPTAQTNGTISPARLKFDMANPAHRTARRIILGMVGVDLADVDVVLNPPVVATHPSPSDPAVLARLRELSAKYSAEPDLSRIPEVKRALERMPGRMPIYGITASAMPLTPQEDSDLRRMNLERAEHRRKSQHRRR